ncbi:MAG: hypothetical protein ACE5G1_05415 [bacterium]
MPTSSGQLSKEQFRDELLKRFFHPDSYFSHCFANHLQSILDEHGNSNNEYLLVGNLMDKLQASDKVLEDIQALTALTGFEGFGQRLDEGIQYLFDTDLEPEKMKLEIEGLAQSLFQDSLDVIQNEDANNDFKEFIGVQVPVSDPEISTEEENAVAEPEELPLKKADPRAPILSSADRQDIASAAETVAGGTSFRLEDSKNAFDIGEFERGLLEEGGLSKPAEESDEQTTTVAAPHVGGEHDALALTVKHLDRQVEKVLTLIDSNSQIHEQITELDGLFAGLVSPAMIYGLDAVEEVAIKARRFLTYLKTGPEFEDSLARNVLREAAQVLKAALGEDAGSPDAATIKDLCAKLGDPDKIPAESYELVDQKKTAEPVLDTLPQSQELQEEEIDLSQLKLPGEDEIVGLIGEITRQNRGGEDKGLVRETAGQEQRSEVVFAEVSEPAQTRELESYMSQANLYLSVVDQAMEILASQPGHKTALEDVELACNSLSTLSLKMNFDELAELPGLVADLVKNIAANRYSLSKEEHGLIDSAFTQFRRLSSIVETDKAEFKAVLASIQKLNSKVMADAQTRREFRNIDKFKDRRQRY